MATISRIRRLVNPGRKKKRKLSALQKLFFGSKRQRTAIKANRGRKRKRSVAVKHTVARRRRRKRNVGSIITVRAKRNPSRVRRYKRRRKNAAKRVIIVNKGVGMTRTRRRTRRATSKRVYRRRRRAVAVNPRRRRRARRNVSYVKRIKRGRYMYSNPGRRRRRSRVGHRRTHRSYRRNPGVLTGTMGRVGGALLGIGATRVLSGFLPSMFTQGILGYVGIGAVAYLQAKVGAKVSKSTSFGNDMLIGGLAYLGAKVLNDFLPSIGSYTGISGMGLIGGSSFYVPQVNRNGSMGSFVLPGAVGSAIASIPTKAGMGVMRRTGRLM